jgi:Caspase domain
MKPPILIKVCVLAAIWLLCLPSFAANRVALVIGNAEYTIGRLKNPVNDAIAMEKKLIALGFKVQRVDNLKKDQIGRMLAAFGNSIQPGDDVLVFYAGHGVQVNGINYLLAVDADIQVEEDVPQNSLSLNALMAKLEKSQAGVKLVFLDACRNNPYHWWRSTDRGMARMNTAPKGTLLYFATQPGGVAADGEGENGIYTKALLEFIATPGIPVEVMTKRVTITVNEQTRGKQVPWHEGSMLTEFYFSELILSKEIAAKSELKIAPKKNDANAVTNMGVPDTGQHGVTSKTTSQPMVPCLAPTSALLPKKNQSSKKNTQQLLHPQKAKYVDPVIVGSGPSAMVTITPTQSCSDSINELAASLQLTHWVGKPKPWTMAVKILARTDCSKSEEKIFNSLCVNKLKPFIDSVRESNDEDGFICPRGG